MENNAKQYLSNNDLFYNFNLLTDFKKGYEWQTYFKGVENSETGLEFARILSMLTNQHVRFEIIEAMDTDSVDTKIATFKKIVLGIDLTDDEIDLLIEELKTNNKNVKVLYADNLLTLEI
jgi:hypothetical protein